MKCSNCGFDDSTPAARPWKNEMFAYVTEDGKDFGIINDDLEVIDAPPSKQYPKGLKLIRKDVFDKKTSVLKKQGTPTP